MISSVHAVLSRDLGVIFRPIFKEFVFVLRFYNM